MPNNTTGTLEQKKTKSNALVVFYLGSPTKQRLQEGLPRMNALYSGKQYFVGILQRFTYQTVVAGGFAVYTFYILR